MAAPDSIPNLDAWWKADSLALADGATVSSWADSGPVGFTATQGTASARPTFRTGVLNGKPVVRFDGVDDFLISSASTSHTETTIFSVIKPTSTSGDRSIRVASGSGGITSTIRDGKPRMGSQDLVSLHTSTTTISTTAFQALTCSYSDSTNTVAFHRNGSADGSSTSVTASPTAGRTTQIAAEPAGGYLVGDLAELIVYSRVLNSTERSQVHSYLQDKYGIAVADYVPSDEQITVADTAVGTETLTVGDSATVVDSGTGTDAVTVTDAETFVVADTANATDTVATADFTTEAVTVADTGTGTDAATVAESTTSPDTGTGVDAVTVTETFAVVDTAVGADTASVHDTQSITVTDFATGVDHVTVLDVPYTAPSLLEVGPAYDLVAVARLPQQQGPPLFMEIDPIEWRSLRWADVLSAPQELEASALLTRLPPTVLQRLERPHAFPTELWLYRNGDLVCAGPLTGWSKGTDTVTIKASGVLAYTWSMFVETDLRFDQVDQFTIARTLVDNWQATEYGHFGIDTSAVGESGVLRDGTYARAEIHKVGQRIEELGRRRNGFDVEVDPSTRRLQLWHPLKGVDRSDGEDAIVIDERSITSGQVVCSVSPGDVASEGFGAGSSAGGDATLWSHQTNLDVRATYGRTGVAGTWSDVSEQPTLDAHVQGMLDARADALIVPGPGMRVTPDTDLGAYAVGDTILYDESHALLGPVGAFRIRKREVTVSPDGKQESVSIEFV